MGLISNLARALRGAADRLSQLDPPPPVPARPGAGSQGRRVPIYDRWHRVNHPGHGLTPRRIVEIFAQAERGFPIDQCDLFDDIIERDLHLRSQFEQRIGAVAGSDWVLVPGGDSAADAFAARALEERLRQVPNIGETFVHQLKAPAYGWAGSELVWGMVDSVIAPTWFVNVPARRFRFDPRDVPMVLTDRNWITGEPLEAGRWWLSRRAHAQTVRSGYMRTAVLAAYFKSLSLRDWIVWIERFGLPTVYGLYDENAADDEKDALLEAVKMLGKDGSAIFSRLSEIKIEHASGGNAEGPHAALMSAMDHAMTKLITGAPLMADGADGGSYAQSKVQQGVRFDITREDAHQLALSFEQQVGVPFVRFNGLDARAPRLKIHIVKDVDPAARMDVFVRGVNELGLEIDQEQVFQEFALKRAPAGRAIPGAPKPKAPGGLDPEK